MSKPKPKSKTKSVQRWEYMWITENCEVDFAKLGWLGWELVSVTRNNGGEIHYDKYYFKRPLK